MKRLKNIINNPKVIFLILFILVFATKLPSINIPYVDDAKFWYVPKSLLIMENNFNPIFYDKGLPSYLIIEGYNWDLNKLDDFGHPPLFYEMLALVYYIFGYSVIISHIVVFIFSFLAVFFTYLLGREIVNSEAGFAAAILLFFSPMFFAQSSSLTPAVTTTALIVMTIYFLTKKNYCGYLISGTALVLIKESGNAVILISAIYILFQKLKEKNGYLTAFTSSLKFLAPIGFFVWWLIFHKINTGMLLHSGNVASVSSISGFLFNFFSWIKFVLFNQFRFILTILLLYGLWQKKDLKIKKELILMAAILFSFFISLSYIEIKHARHMLPIFPLFFIICVSFISIYLKKKNWLLILSIIISILFVSQYHSIQTFEFDENLRFFDIVETKKQAMEFIENNYSNVTIWVDGYSYPDYVYPYVGYVKEPFNVKRIPVDVGKYETKPFQNYFKKGDLIIETKFISHELKPEYNYRVQILNIKLIKEINVHNDFIRIYEVVE